MPGATMPGRASVNINGESPAYLRDGNQSAGFSGLDFCG